MNMKMLRKRARLTQTKLAKMVGVTQVYISKIERGEIDGLTIGKLKKIAKILKVTPTELLEILMKK